MSNAQENKVREFFVYEIPSEADGKPHLRVIRTKKESAFNDDWIAIHCVEHSAYLSLQAENERLAKELINLSVEHPCYRLSKELEAENEKLKEANKKLRELLERLRKEPSLMKIPKWGAQDMYAGLPPAMRLIDVALSEADKIERG